MSGVLLRQLEYLVALARERHYASAAQACFVSQPSLSDGIRRLEEEFNVPIVRHNKRFDGFTPEGERVLQWARRLLAERDAMHEDLGTMREGPTGRLRIGAVPTALTAVSLLAAPFGAEYPRVRVSLTSDLPSREILRQLDTFDLDAGVTYLEDQPLDGMLAIPLYREHYVFLTPEAGEFGQREAVTWAEAAGTPLCLLSPVMQGRRVLDTFFAEASTPPAPQVETDSISMLCALVTTQRWSSVLPHAWLHVFDVPEGMHALPIVEPERTTRIGLLVADRDPKPVVTRALLDVAQQVDIAGAMDRLLPTPLLAS